MAGEKQKQQEAKAERKAKPETPSGIALDRVGPPPEGASDEELNEHAAEYQAVKKAARWG